MTVEIAQLAVNCAKEQLTTARELLIEAIISEAGGDPETVQTTLIGKGHTTTERTPLVDPFTAVSGLF